MNSVIATTPAGMLAAQTNTAHITLSNGMVATVSAEDYAALSAHSWHALKHRNTWYAYMPIRRDGKETTVTMHRFVLGVSDRRVIVDHRDGDGLNNRRGNLRECSQAQNTMNSAAKSTKQHDVPRGITWDHSRQKWQVEISANKVRHRLGRFASLDEAIRVRRDAEQQLHGEFACTRMRARR